MRLFIGIRWKRVGLRLLMASAKSKSIWLNPSRGGLYNSRISKSPLVTWKLGQFLWDNWSIFTISYIYFNVDG